MQPLDNKQKRLVKLARAAVRNPADAALVALDVANEVEDNLDSFKAETEKNFAKIKEDTPDLTEVLKSIKGAPGETGIGEKGDKGDKGDPGEQGPPGKDGSNGVDGKDGATGKNGRDGIDGRDGVDGVSVDENKLLNRVIDQIPRPRGAKGFTLYVGGAKKLLTAQTLNLVAGAGITLSYASANGRNDVTITATGSASLVPIAVTGTIDDSNTTFTAASTPNLVIINGASYRDGHGCAISGTTITLNSPVGTGGDIYCL